MTGLAQSPRFAAQPQRGDASGYPGPSPSQPGRRGPRRSAGFGGWRGLAWLAGGLVGGVAAAGFIFLGPGESGSKAEWFFGGVVLIAVAVTMWQTLNIRRQARHDAAAAAERLQMQLAAAEARSARELALTQALHSALMESEQRLHRTEMESQQTLHRAEMESQQTLHRAEMEAQQESSRVARVHLLGQLQRQAITEISRAVSAQVQMLATLWNESASVLCIDDRDERERAMNPIFEQIGQAVKDFSIEINNAHLTIEDDRLHQALDGVNAAVLMAIRVAEDVHVAVVDGRAPHPNPIPGVAQVMNARAAEARHLAWDLLRNGLDHSAASTE